MLGQERQETPIPFPKLDGSKVVAEATSCDSDDFAAIEEIDQVELRTVEKAATEKATAEAAAKEAAAEQAAVEKAAAAGKPKATSFCKHQPMISGSGLRQGGAKTPPHALAAVLPKATPFFRGLWQG